MAVEGKAQGQKLKYRSSFDVPEVGWHLQGKVVVEDREVAVDRQGYRMEYGLTHSCQTVVHHPFRIPSSSRDPYLHMEKDYN